MCQNKKLNCTPVRAVVHPGRHGNILEEQKTGFKSCHLSGDHLKSSKEPVMILTTSV